MSKPTGPVATLRRLLQRKRGLAGSPDPTPVDAPPSPLPSGTLLDARMDAECVVCGYNLVGQTVDRCPECGLPLASGYRDPLQWMKTRPLILGWWWAAAGVWQWDRRIRVRTSLVPATPPARRFAAWSIALCTIPAALAAGGLEAMHPRGSSLRAMAAFLAAAPITWLLLRAILFLLRIATTGRWRQAPFVPASTYYATAWWPPAACALLFVILMDAVIVADVDGATVRTVASAGVLLWALWLWASIAESGRVRHVGWRVAAVAVLVLVGVSTALSVTAGSTVSLTEAVAAAVSNAVVKMQEKR